MRELKWCFFLFSLISFLEEMQLKTPLLLSFHTTWCVSWCCGEICVAMMLENWLPGACSINFLQFYCPLFKNSNIVVLLNLLLLLENWSNGPLPSHYPTKKNSYQIRVSIGYVAQFGVCSLACITKSMTPQYPSFCTQGWIFGKIFLSKYLPKGSA